MLHVAPGEKIAALRAKARSALKADFNLAKGLKPFPERANVVAETRNLFQRLVHLQRLLARSTLSRSETQKSYRILQACLESNAVRRAQATLRRGIQFGCVDILAAMKTIEDTLGSLEPRTLSLPPDCSLILCEISNGITRILRYSGDDLTVDECQLKDRDVLCAIRYRAGRLRDTAVETVS